MEGEKYSADAAGMRALYADYIGAVEEFYKGRKAADLFGSMFSGRGRYGDCKLHEPFWAQLEQMIEAIAQRPLPSREADEIVQFMLLKNHVGAEHPARLPLEVAEGKALPLLPFLDEKALNMLLDSYRKRLKKEPGLPCQREVLKTMKTLLLDKTRS